MTVSSIMCAGLSGALTGWYLPGMRIYIEITTHLDRPKYLLLDNLEEFGKDSLLEGWRIRATRAPSAMGGRSETLASGMEENVAVRAMDELLGLTGDSAEGAVAVIRWDGEHFTRRFV